MDTYNNYEKEDQVAIELEDAKYQEQLGARLTLSQLASISEKITAGNEINKEESKENLKEEASREIFEQQTRNLIYFTQIYQRAGQLDRDPTTRDFLNTFPSKGIDHIADLHNIAKQKEVKSQSTPEQKAEKFWEVWKDSQIFHPIKKQFTYSAPTKKIKLAESTILSPTEVKNSWNNNTLMREKLDRILYNAHNPKKLKDIDVHKYLIINDVNIISNITLENSRLQIVPLIHGIHIPINYPEEPMEIIYYKTGTVPNRADNLKTSQKLQLFLSTLCTKMTIDSLIDKGIVTYTAWDLLDSSKKEFPQFSKHNMSFSNPFLNKMNIEEILEHSLGDRSIRNSVVTTMYNPITNRKLTLRPKDIFLGDRKDILCALSKIEEITKYYIEHKQELKKLSKSKVKHYNMPKFTTDKEQSVEPVQLTLDLF